jgi:peptide/nickel transport system ATP-binding protein
MTETLLRTGELSFAYPQRASLPFNRPSMREVVKRINLAIPRGSVLGLVGESGSGKTTLGRLLVRLLRPTSGGIQFDGIEIGNLDEREMRPLRARIQMIFQDPQSSLNPRLRLGATLTRPIRIHRHLKGRRDARDRAAALLDLVGLPDSFVDRYPHELSGGQRQRAGIARALALEPDFIVADEIVSGLDVSTQAHILLLLKELRAKLGLTLVFISHDLSVVRVLCDDVAILQQGEVVEYGPVARIFSAPQHAYTRQLLSAIPLPDVEPGWLDDANPRVISNQQGPTRMTETIKDSVVLITGASGAIAQALIAALKARGARKIYAAARNISGMAASDGVVPIKMDVNSDEDVRKAAATATDVTILINNAGINHNISFMLAIDLSLAREEFECNYIAPLRVTRAFAPALIVNKGAVLNMLTILSRVNLPFMGSYCASKAAALSLTQGLRAELGPKGVRVLAALPGAVDTRMTAGLPIPKMTTADAAAEILDGFEKGEEETYVGDMARGLAEGLAKDPKGVERQLANPG